MPLVRSPQSRSASSSALRESIDQIRRPQPSKGRGPSAEDPLRGHSQVRRRGEVEYPGDVSNVVSGILGQLRTLATLRHLARASEQRLHIDAN